MTPTLETDRLLLRGHAVSDFDAGLHIWRDPLVTKYVGGKPSTGTRAGPGFSAIRVTGRF